MNFQVLLLVLGFFEVPLWGVWGGGGVTLFRVEGFGFESLRK